MRNVLIIVALASTLAGCASPLPTCDGTARRPVNEPPRTENVFPSCGDKA